MPCTRTRLVSSIRIATFFLYHGFSTRASRGSHGLKTRDTASGLIQARDLQVQKYRVDSGASTLDLGRDELAVLYRELFELHGRRGSAVVVLQHVCGEALGDGFRARPLRHIKPHLGTF